MIHEQTKQAISQSTQEEPDPSKNKISFQNLETESIHISSPTKSKTSAQTDKLEESTNDQAEKLNLDLKQQIASLNLQISELKTQKFDQ